MGVINFHSKSAMKCKTFDYGAIEVPKIRLSKYVLIADTMMSDEFVDFGKSLGFESFFFDPQKDMGRIPKASYFILNELREYQFHTLINSINFAISWNVPTVWIHSLIEPAKWMSQFTHIFVGSFSEKELWKSLCNIE